MDLRRPFLVAAWCVACLILPLSLSAHGPSGNHKEAAEHDEEAMRAQHERMGNFREAMQNLSEAIVLSNVKIARESAEQLASSIKGHEKDAPHKNVAKAKEFHGLYVEMEKRAKGLQATLKAGDLPKAGIAYGRILEVCATCHRKFRD